MSRSARSRATSFFRAAISARSARIWPFPGKAAAGAAVSSRIQRRRTLSATSRSRAACATATPRSVTNLTASILNSRLNSPSRHIHSPVPWSRSCLRVRETGSSSTCRCPSWLSSTTRTLSPSFQCRRRSASPTDRISIWGVNVRSTIPSFPSDGTRRRDTVHPAPVQTDSVASTALRHAAWRVSRSAVGRDGVKRVPQVQSSDRRSASG
jgi:hypothetical protein